MAKTNHKLVHQVTATVFSLVALVHLYRFVYAVPVTFGNTSIPLWASGAGFVVAAALAWWLWKTQ